MTTYSLTKSKSGCLVLVAVALVKASMWGLGIHTVLVLA